MDSEGTLWDQDTASFCWKFFCPTRFCLAVPMSIPRRHMKMRFAFWSRKPKSTCASGVSACTPDRCLSCDYHLFMYVRMMYDFKRWQQNPAERQATIEEAIKAETAGINMFADSCSTGAKRLSMMHDAHRHRWCQAYDSTEMQLEQKCVQFEDILRSPCPMIVQSDSNCCRECLGTLLRKAFMHVAVLLHDLRSCCCTCEG